MKEMWMVHTRLGHVYLPPPTYTIYFVLFNTKYRRVRNRWTARLIGTFHGLLVWGDWLFDIKWMMSKYRFQQSNNAPTFSFCLLCQRSEVSSLKLIISFHAYPCFSLFRYIHCRTFCVGEFGAVIGVCVLGFNHIEICI
jgi:hypothetical protein